MGIVRTLLIVVAIFVALMLLKRVLGGRPRTPAAPPKTPRLVQCAHCGLHVNESEALRAGERYFCSAEHRQRAEKS